MRVVITYGTYDLFHTGHYNILKRAKERGDYLIVGVTSDAYDKARGKLNVKQSLSERIENVKNTGLADKIIVEEYMGQKIDDIIKYNVDEFVLGSDWLGKFDYLNEYCKVTYLERTKGVSSTQLRNENYGILRIGYAGNVENSKDVIQESKYVSGLEFTKSFSLDEENAIKVFKENMLESYTTDYLEFLDGLDAVYISRIDNQYNYVKIALENKKHVLFERNNNLTENEIQKLYNFAKENNLILFEAITTIYSPGFSRLSSMLKAGTIGEIKSMDITYSKTQNDINDSLIYPLMAISKIMGTDYVSVDRFDVVERGKITYKKVNIKFRNSIASLQITKNMKLNDEITIIGTNGYVIVEKPWWKTEVFTVYNEEKTRKHSFDFDEEGIRYELSDFLNTISTSDNYQKIFELESKFVSKIMEEVK